MSSNDAHWLLKHIVWTLALGIAWYGASRGYTYHPCFEMWFWGIAFGLEVVLFLLTFTLVIFEPVMANSK